MLHLLFPAHQARRRLVRVAKIAGPLDLVNPARCSAFKIAALCTVAGELLGLVLLPTCIDRPIVRPDRRSLARRLLGHRSKAQRSTLCRELRSGRPERNSYRGKGQNGETFRVLARAFGLYRSRNCAPGSPSASHVLPCSVQRADCC